MARAHCYTAWFLYALIGAVFLVLATTYPAAYVRMTYEDLYGEWLQTWLFVAVLVLAVPLATRRWRYRWCFALLALAAFYTVMEEISWGQRLLGIESPAFFAEHNVQGETNLHNFLTGPDSTLVKDVVEYTLAAALIAFGLLYPLALRLGWAPARWLDRVGVAAPPLYLWIFFVNAAVFEVGWLKFNEAEVAEILVGTALVLMLLHYRLAADAPADRPGPAALTAAAAGRCAGLQIAGFALLVGLAFGTTTWLYSLPGQAAGIERRLANGYEKFGRRMAARERWNHAAELYRQAAELRPAKLPLMQAALDNYQAAGNSERYNRYYRAMLDATAAELGGADATVENLLMLATEYAGIDAPVPATDYLNRALATAAANVAAAPDSSENHYWLGRVQQQRGRYADALTAYRRAQALDPGRGRYTLAVRSLQREMAAAAGEAATAD